MGEICIEVQRNTYAGYKIPDTDRRSRIFLRSVPVTYLSKIFTCFESEADLPFLSEVKQSYRAALVQFNLQGLC